MSATQIPNITVMLADDNLFLVPNDDNADDILELFSNAKIVLHCKGAKVTAGHKLVLELKR